MPIFAENSKKNGGENQKIANMGNSVIKYIKLQPVSCLLILIIWIICMIPVPETPLNDVKFIDKWTHLMMYGTLVLVIMGEYGRRKTKTLCYETAKPTTLGSAAFIVKRRKNAGATKAFNIKRLLVGGLLLPIVMGGLVELAQAYLTNGVRSGDWLDFAANSLGAIIGSVIGIPLARFLAIRNKDA